MEKLMIEKEQLHESIKFLLSFMTDEQLKSIEEKLEELKDEGR